MNKVKLEYYISKEKKSLISGPFGSNISSKFFVSSGIPVIRGNNLTYGDRKFIDSGFVFVSEEKADELGCDAIKNDIIITAAGTIGQIGLITNDLKYNRYVISNKQIRLRLDNSVCDVKFIYLLLNSEIVRQQIINNNTGSTIPLINLSVVRNILIPEFDLPTQQKIASVLSALDDKIELNNRINSELETMAKTLYDYWFVQFDFPVSDALASTPLSQQSEAGGERNNVAEHEEIMVTESEKNTVAERKGVMVTKSEKNTVAEHEGVMVAEREKNNVVERKGVMVAESEKNTVAERSRGYKSSGGKMVYNETLKREIPEGWGVTVFNDWIKNTKAGDWGKETIEGNYTERVYCVRGADINGINGKGEVNAPERFILKNNSSKKLIPNDFVVEISGGSPVQSTGRIALITESTLERFDTDIICSNFCKAVSIKDEKYIYNFKQEWQRLYDAGIFFGFEGKTSGIKNFLFDSFMNSYSIVLPQKEIVEKYYEFAKTIDKKIQSNLKQNQELSALRDWLLPMLMNGQVKVE